MGMMIGALTLASTLCAAVFGQINSGTQLAGVILASVVAMTVRA